MAAFGVITWTASLLVVCLSHNHHQATAQAPSPDFSQTNTPLSSTSNNANPSLLLALLDSFSESSPSQSNPLQTKQTVLSAAETTKYSSSTATELSSSPNQSMLSSSSSSGTGQATAGSPPLISLNRQHFLRDLALLNSNRHTPLHIALAKGEAITAAEQAAEVNQLMKMIVLMSSARSLECKTVGEVVEGESMLYLPLSCRSRCPRRTSCKTIGLINFCCPLRVTTSPIQLNAFYGPIDQ